MIPPLRSRLHHGFTLKELSPEVRDNDGGRGALPMTWHLVREHGEPFALVASIDLACEIVFSRPPGYYTVYEIQVDPLRLRTQSAGGWRSTRHADGCMGIVRGRGRDGRFIPATEWPYKPLHDAVASVRS